MNMFKDRASDMVIIIYNSFNKLTAPITYQRMKVCTKQYSVFIFPHTIGSIKSIFFTMLATLKPDWPIRISPCH